MKIEDAIEGLRLQLEYFDEECRYDASIEGGEAEHWDELEVSAEAVRALLKYLRRFEDKNADSDALNAAADTLITKRMNPYHSVQGSLWEAIRTYAEWGIGRPS